MFGGIEDLPVAAQYYSTFLRQLYCGGDLYPGQGPVCQYNATHQGVCSADCIKGLENSSAYCGCGSTIGPQCASSPRHIFCCLDTCAQELKMDLGFVLDASGSVGLVNYQLQLNFTAELLRQMNVGVNKTHVSIINYSSWAETLTWLNEDYSLQEKLQRLADATYFSGGTNTALGLQTANMTFSYENGRRPLEEGATPVIFVITDGASNDQSATISAANILKESGILVVSVGVGSGPNLNELHAICSPPANENYFAMSDYTTLKRKLNQFTARSCTQPSLITLNMTMSGEIQKDKYKFLKIDLTKIKNKALITVALLDGMVELFYSFVNQNPKDPSDFIDYTAKSNVNSPLSANSYYEQSLTKKSTTKISQVDLTIEKPDDQTNFTYIGVKGIEEINIFTLKIGESSQVNSNLTSSAMKPSNMLPLLFFIAFLH